MAKYIDRDQFIDWLKTEIKFKDLSDGLGVCMVIMKEDFERAIKHMPDSIIKDVAPVKHGRWEHNSDFPDRFICCGCGSMFDMWKHEQRFFNYCPNCGAKMDGERKENE